MQPRGPGTNLITDSIVRGVNNSGLQERLLREPKLTLQKDMDNFRACEISRKQVKAINDSMNTIGAINIHPIRRSNTVHC